MRRRLRRWAPCFSAWLLVPALGVALRLVPVSTSPGNTWVADAAAHDRLVEARVEHGRLPDPDALTDLPGGRHLGRFLPLGLYEAAAAWHQAAAWLGGRSLAWSLAWFTALAGALVAWPVWNGARAIGAGPWGAVVAAFLSVVIPAHVWRTTAFMLRYDALGTAMITTHTLLGVAALAAPSRRAGLVNSVLSGLALIGALAVWRVPLVVPALEAMVVAVVAIARPPSAQVRVWMAATAIALVVACMALEYLRTQGHLLSMTTTVVFAVAAILQVPILRRPATRARARAAVILVAIAVAAALGAGLGHRGDYAFVGSLLGNRLLAPLGLGGPTDPMTAVLLSVKELGPMSVGDLFGANALSWLGLWVLAAPAALWFRSGRSPRAWARGAGEPLVVLLGTAVALAVLSLLMMRHRILLAPLVAALAGACVSAFANEGGAPGSAAATGGTAGEPPRHASRPESRVGSPRRRPDRGGGGRPAALAARAVFVRRLALAALVPCLAVTVRDAWSAAVKSVTGLDLGMPATIAYLREHARGGPVLSFWDRGYELQRYAGCATVTDGMLESEVNQKHIVESARAFLAATPDSLAALCERWGVEYLVIPPRWYILGVAMPAGGPLADRLRAGLPLTPQEADRVVIRMMLTGKPEPPFEPVFERGHYRIYRRVPLPQPASVAGP